MDQDTIEYYQELIDYCKNKKDMYAKIVKRITVEIEMLGLDVPLSADAKLEYYTDKLNKSIFKYHRMIEEFNWARTYQSSHG